MKETSLVNRFAALSVRTGLSLGIMYSSRVDDFNLMLAVAARSFAAGRRYSEREVNDILQIWLASVGSMLAVDHVELRRWLVDCRVLARDDYGHAYALAAPAPEFALLASTLSGVDLAAVAAAARARDAEVRQERKRKWAEAAQGGDSGARGG
jgi:hypothetical protein